MNDPGKLGYENDGIDELRARYFLPQDYIHADQALTLNSNSKNELHLPYWEEKRLMSLGTTVYQFPVYQYAVEKIKELKCKSLIDVGCGAGAKLKYIHQSLPDLNIIGIDQNAAISFCKKKYEFGQWIHENFDEPSNQNDSIHADIVLCCDVIEHVMKPDILLSYIRKKVSPDGYVIVSTPDREAKYGMDIRTPGHIYHVREWSYHEFSQFITDQGFKIIEHFHQWPVKVSFNKIFIREIYNQLRSRHKLRYNQVCLLKLM